MGAEKRKKPRKFLRYTAWVSVGEGVLVSCVVADVSETGARLDVDAPEQLPERFVLMLSDRGPARRLCRAIWRSPTQIGVRFEKNG